MSTAAAIDPRHAAGQRLRERLFRGATFIAAMLVLTLLGGVAVSLVQGAWPAFAHFKLHFLTSAVWNPVTEKFGALAAVYGTLVTSFIALLIAIPVSFGIAIFLTELAPQWLKRPVGIAIELLAAVPSIIFGIWGLFVLAPILQARAAVAHRDPRTAAPRRKTLSGSSVRHRHSDCRHRAGGDDHSVHLGRDARCLRDGSGRSQGVGLWPRRHHLGGDLAGGRALRAYRRDRRRHARARARARRDHGCHVRHRQRTPDRLLAPRARHHDLGLDRQRVYRGGR